MKELDYFHAKTQDQKVTSIFFGGGTPSLMQPDSAAAVINHIKAKWPTADDMEITLEANPNSVEVSRFKDFRGTGINRVSVGVQSLRQDELRFLGRTHDVSEARKAIETAINCFDRVSFDLIYARPHQTVKAWQEELNDALQYQTGHLSLYQLTIEPNTRFQRDYALRKFELPPEVQSAELYETTYEIMAKHGLDPYEVSNYGDPSLHNLCYWRYEDYLGVGPGAHGRITVDGKKYRTENIRAPEAWMDCVEKKGSGLKEEAIVEVREKAFEKLMMGLRLYEGCEVDWAYIDHGKALTLQDEGYLKIDGNHIHPTRRGILCLNQVIQFLWVDAEQIER